MATHNRVDPKKLEIGRRIAAARKKLALSQHELAVRLTVTANAVTQWETGRAVPQAEKFQQLSRELQVTPEWLLTGDDPEEQRRAQTTSELQALSLLRRLPPDEQAKAIAVLEALAGQKARG